MSATDKFEAGIMNLIFQNTAFALIGDAGGLQPSAAAGSFQISLHTASPGDTGDQSTSETTYTSYARVAVNRTTTAWTHATATGITDNDAAINFPTAGSAASLTSFGIGSDSTAGAAGNLWFYGTATLTVSTLVAPSFAIGALDITCD